jgi:hypothetical protein
MGFGTQFTKEHINYPLPKETGDIMKFDYAVQYEVIASNSLFSI